MKHLYFFALLIGTMSLSAQNLVPNPGFETQTDCPDVSEIELAPPWNSPSNATPDLFNSDCPTQNGHGRTGIGSSGIFTRIAAGSSSYREYIQAPLDAPLVAGVQYDVSFWVQRFGFRWATNGMGAYFSNSSISESTTSGLFSYTAQVAENAVIESTGWTEVSGTFTAAGGESWILIGCFYDNATQIVTEPTSVDDSVAYYRIDDVLLVESGGGTGLSGLFPADVKIFPNPVSEHLRLQFKNSSISEASLEIFDTRGLLKHNQRLNLHEQTGIDVSAWTAGLYMVRITSSEGAIWSTQILVNR